VFVNNPGPFQKIGSFRIFETAAQVEKMYVFQIFGFLFIAAADTLAFPALLETRQPSFQISSFFAGVSPGGTNNK